MDGDIRSSSSELSESEELAQPLTNGGTPKKQQQQPSSLNNNNQSSNSSSSSNNLKGSAAPKAVNGEKRD